MIRIRRGAEPPALVTSRVKRLSAAVKAYNKHGPGSRELTSTLVGYDAAAVKDTLYLAQAKKCAWCERRRDYSSSPVDHFRPKDGAWRHSRGRPVRTDRGHYWWLTWTWTNLLFVCPRCNDRGHKASFFPLAAGSAALAMPKRPHRGRRGRPFFDTLSEQPLLIDPAIDDPLDHITWKPLQTALARRDWKWSPSGLTPRGTATIEVLKLVEVADELEHHLRTAILPSLEELEEHFRAGRTAQGAGRWNSLITEVLAHGSPLSAATWCALEIWMPAAERTRLGLAHPRRPGP
jgi:hypothetical protein